MGNNLLKIILLFLPWTFNGDDILKMKYIYSYSWNNYKTVGFYFILDNGIYTIHIYYVAMMELLSTI